MKNFSKEIFIIDEKTNKPTVLQYHTKKLFEVMLARCQKWQSEGKLHILDVRDSVYQKVTN